MLVNYFHFCLAPICLNIRLLPTRPYSALVLRRRCKSSMGDNYYAKFEYKGMKTVGVIYYTNQTPCKHCSSSAPSKMRKPSYNVHIFNVCTTIMQSSNIKKWKLLDLQITQNRHLKVVWTEHYAYFWPALSGNWSWKLISGIFESGHFTQVILYNNCYC